MLIIDWWVTLSTLVDRVSFTGRLNKKRSMLGRFCHAKGYVIASYFSCVKCYNNVLSGAVVSLELGNLAHLRLRLHFLKAICFQRLRFLFDGVTLLHSLVR